MLRLELGMPPLLENAFSEVLRMPPSRIGNASHNFENAYRRIENDFRRTENASHALRMLFEELKMLLTL